ncbi:MAG: ATPase [Flammeovirgaceae bacterium]|nr:ATPase [Flammeovirgaceae bacterium]MBE60829.1 ATPase [Flammeovirgaceae bacterium]HCX21987.1 ATPase [Cytophagales bacterium]|tara:strand:- start:6370 stop:8442 length:2073 start_codon:yes stop_codon:yes gene_type:complete
MNMQQFDFDHLRNLTVGTVDYVSPNEIRVVLDLSAPQNTALNTGVPTLFPRINGFVLIPNENGALVGLISWLGVEHSQYPKRKGYKDFDLIDLPFPLRKMSITPMGTLKQVGKIEKKEYQLERGVYSFPSVGDSVILPSDSQLKSIVENKEKNANVKIGIAPIAGNANVKINPDKLFGRHIAILGNTGSGKSCSVAGVIRWSLEEASKKLEDGESLNTRFIILDPNGEYTDAFDDLKTEVKKFKVEISEEEKEIFRSLKVPAWLWNSYEWSSFSNASGRTQRPLLKQALRELKTNTLNNTSIHIGRTKRFILTSLFSFQTDLNNGANSFSGKPGKNDFGNKLQVYVEGLNHYSNQIEEPIKAEVVNLSTHIEAIRAGHYAEYQGTPYYNNFSVQEVEDIIDRTSTLLKEHFPESVVGSNEDNPIPFDVNEIANYVDSLAEKEGKLQFVDFLTMRIRTMLSDSRMSSIIVDSEEVTLENWLENIVDGISIIDLSLVPSDITHLVVSVISRVVFESLQRYRRMYNKLLPTNIVMEEAHNFIKRYHEGSDEISASQLCTQSFEKIAREGRKFGLGLTLSSQRPSELSPTVLSQCNTFLLHRIVNDRDQELVKKLVPDNIGGLLKELPILPTRKAILLGWATPIPILVEMNNLKKEHRPKSEDPDYWDVWTGQSERTINWKDIADDWQNIDEEE